MRQDVGISMKCLFPFHTHFFFRNKWSTNNKCVTCYQRLFGSFFSLFFSKQWFCILLIHNRYNRQCKDFFGRKSYIYILFVALNCIQVRSVKTCFFFLACNLLDKNFPYCWLMYFVLCKSKNINLIRFSDIYTTLVIVFENRRCITLFIQIFFAFSCKNMFCVVSMYG